MLISAGADPTYASSDSELAESALHRALDDSEALIPYGRKESYQVFFSVHDNVLPAA